MDKEDIIKKLINKYYTINPLLLILPFRKRLGIMNKKEFESKLINNLI